MTHRRYFQGEKSTKFTHKNPRCRSVVPHVAARVEWMNQGSLTDIRSHQLIVNLCVFKGNNLLFAPHFNYVNKGDILSRISGKSAPVTDIIIDCS